MKEVNLIQFDWSGTISDDRRPVHIANSMLATHYGVPPIDDFEAWLKATVSGPQEYIQQFGVKVPADQIWEQYKKTFAEIVASGLRPVMYENVPEVLSVLKDKGKILAVLSRHPEENLRAEVAEYGLGQYFDIVTGSIPDKVVGIKQICYELKANAEHTVYIGDMIPDIVAARQANVRPIVVSYGYHSEEMLRTQGDVTIWKDLQPAKHEL